MNVPQVRARFRGANLGTGERAITPESRHSMKNTSHIPRYNRAIRQMQARMPGGLRLGRLASFLLASVLLPSYLAGSNLSDAARQMAHKIGLATGPGAIALEVTNKSSLDDKSVREIRTALDEQLRVEGVRTVNTDQAVGTVRVTLSESLREYVWAAEITIGSDEKKVALVSLPRMESGGAAATAMPVVLKNTSLFAQEQPMLDAALIDMTGGARLLVLGERDVTMYRQQSGRWERELELPIANTRSLPRDPRGRLLLRRDHLFDVYLPGTFCRSGAATPLTLVCNESDDPWPLTPDDNSVRAFFAPTRNFFTGALSPGIGKIAAVPSFYSAAPLPRSSYTLWVLSSVDGSVHLIDGFTDQAVRGLRWGSDLAALRSSCGSGTQILAADSGDSPRDSLRAFEISDREPVAVSSAIDSDGRIVALWPETNGANAMAIVKREDTGWYEANRISIACGN